VADAGTALLVVLVATVLAVYAAGHRLLLDLDRPDRSSRATPALTKQRRLLQLARRIPGNHSHLRASVYL